MSWWHKVPSDAGRRPEMMEVGWAGQCAWQALIAINSAHDFAGRIPAKYARPEFLASTNPDPLGHDDPYPRPDARMMAYGIERLLSAGLAKFLTDAVLELDADTLDDWQAPRAMTSTERSRKHRAVSGNEPQRNVPDATDRNEALHATPPDQNRPGPEQSRERVTPRGLGNGKAGEPDVYVELHAYHIAICNRVAPGKVRDLGPHATRHKISETLHHELIREASIPEIKAALDVLGVEAQAKHDAGDQNPWWLLRDAWSPRVLSRALSMPDAETARMEATTRAQASSKRTGPIARSVPPNDASAFTEDYSDGR